ncbi:MAG: DNA-3-methyladenine glycosylase [Candidatus Nanohaloarchaea archaeon]
MRTGEILLEEIPGPFDLQSTVESGQTYLWRREDGMMFEDSELYGGDAWYYTVLPASYTGEDAEVIKVRQLDEVLEWRSTFDADNALRELLRLEDDLERIERELPGHDVVEQAFDRFRGMRLVKDPVFPCLISFICSAQMRVERIQKMQEEIAESFGSSAEFDGETYYSFPDPLELSEASEDDLRDCGLGYRAPYVESTAKKIASGDHHPLDASSLDYKEARDHMKQFTGVGDKVADCVLLFSLGFLEAVPLDTWIRTSIEEHFPECDAGSYEKTSELIRQELGGDLAGYAQTYVFLHLRTS